MPPVKGPKAAETRRLLVEGEGVRLEVCVRGTGEPVLLLPSLGRGTVDFDALTGALVRDGFRAVGLQPRGVGESRGSLENLGLPDFVADVILVIETVCGGPVHAIGHTFGNRVARYLAAVRPDLVRSLTLLAAGGLVEPGADVVPLARRFMELLGDPAASRRELQELAAAVYFSPASAVPDGWLEGWWPEALRAQRSAPRQPPVADWWRGGEVPMLVIQGLDDRLAVPANGHRLRHELGERVRVADLDRAGHMLLLERPDAVAEEALRFLHAFDRRSTGGGEMR